MIRLSLFEPADPGLPQGVDLSEKSLQVGRLGVIQKNRNLGRHLPELRLEQGGRQMAGQTGDFPQLYEALQEEFQRFEAESELIA